MGDLKKQYLKIKISFNPGYDNLPARLQPDVKNKICKLLGIEYNTSNGNVYFHDYRHGNKKTSPIERMGIEKIFKAFNINPWTGASLH